MSKGVKAIKLVSHKVTTRDEEGSEEVEVWLRFSKNGEEAQIFCGSADNSVHAFERAFRQMLCEFGHLDGKVHESLFHYARLGIIKPAGDDKSRHIYSVKLMAHSKISGECDLELVSGLAEGSTRRAIAKALSILYGKTCGVTINLHWERIEAGE